MDDDRWARHGRTVHVTSNIAVVLVLLLAPLVAFPVRIWLDQNPGPFDRQHFEAIVTRVRKLMPQEDGEVHFRLDDLNDPVSLRQADHPASRDSTGNVWARMTPAGALTVVIMTKDLGHCGEYGFAYSDAPFTIRSADGSWPKLDVPGHLRFEGRQLDEHWWEVLNNLD